MLFDPAHFAEDSPLAPGSALRRWARRLLLILFVGIGAAAALLLFAPLI